MPFKFCSKYREGCECSKFLNNWCIHQLHASDIDMIIHIFMCFTVFLNVLSALSCNILVEYMNAMVLPSLVIICEALNLWNHPFWANWFLYIRRQNVFLLMLILWCWKYGFLFEYIKVHVCLFWIGSECKFVLWELHLCNLFTECPWHLNVYCACYFLDQFTWFLSFARMFNLFDSQSCICWKFSFVLMQDWEMLPLLVSFLFICLTGNWMKVFTFSLNLYAHASK